MTKADRQRIFDKYGGKCAYSGKELPQDWQVDHIEPKRSWMFMLVDDKGNKPHNPNDMSNLIPTLKILNHYKRRKNLEEWRKYLLTLHERLKKLPKKTMRAKTTKRKAYLLEVAGHFGITAETPFCGVFYFETIESDKEVKP